METIEQQKHEYRLLEEQYQDRLKHIERLKKSKEEVEREMKNLHKLHTTLQISRDSDLKTFE